MRLSKRIQSVKPSATLSVSNKAQELKAQGKPIISFALGETDFPTPDFICAAAKQAIDADFTKYTAVAGITPLRTAAAKYFKRFYNVDATAAQVIIGNGGKQLLYNAFQVLLDPGDEVLIPAPYWVSYPDMVRLAEAIPVIVPATAEQGFKITPAALATYFTERTRILVLNSPSNPTGVSYTQQELDALAAWAVERNIVIVSDEIYDQLVYAPAQRAGLAHWWSKYPKSVLICNGLAKSFAMTGWRVGFALGHEQLIKQLSKIQGQSTSNVCSIAQYAALAALESDFSVVTTLQDSFARRRDLAHGLVSAWPDCLCPRPDGAFYLFVDIHKHYTAAMPDSTAACAYLLEHAGVALVPGIAFGDDHCVRISYATSEENITHGLQKIAACLFK